MCAGSLIISANVVELV